MKTIASARDLQTVAQVIEEGDPQLARKVNGLSLTMEQLAPVYAIPARDTDEGVAYVLASEPKPQADYQVLYRSPIAQFANDVLVAWASAEVSEGAAAEVLHVDRLELRKMRMDAIARVAGPVDQDALEERRRQARSALDTFVIQQAIASNSFSDKEIDTIVAFWADLVGLDEFQSLVDDWRALCAPAEIDG